MQTSKRTQSAISTTVNGTTITLTFGNGKTLSLDVTKLNADIATDAVLHGVKQKLVDAAAISRNTVSGASASIEDKYRAVLAVFERITHPTSPAWNSVRGSDGGGNYSGLVRAIAALSKNTHENVKAKLEGKTPQELTALRKSPKIAAKIAEITPRRAVNVDVATLETELGLM